MTRKTQIIKLGFAAAIVVTGLIALGGDLNPPAGQVAPTMKPLDQVEPRVAINAATTPGNAASLFVISGPGSYYLTGNIVGAAGRSGIAINSSRVTLDLNGFALTGVSGSIDGISVGPGGGCITVLNGTITGWGGSGVNGVSIVAEFFIHGTIMAGNGGDGLSIGKLGAIQDCFARANGGRGFAIGDDSRITHCTAIGNGGTGIEAGARCLIMGCATGEHLGTGILAGADSLVCDCKVQASQAAISIGIDAVQGVTVRGNTVGVTPGGLSGIRASSQNRIEGNTLNGQATGGLIRVSGSGNFVARNDLSNGAIVDVGGPNRIGPINDLNNPWANFTD